MSSFSFDSSAMLFSFNSILLSRITPDFSFGMIVKFGMQGIANSLYAFPIRELQRSSYFSIPSVAILLKVVLSPVS